MSADVHQRFDISMEKGFENKKVLAALAHRGIQKYRANQVTGKIKVSLCFVNPSIITTNSMRGKDI